MSKIVDDLGELIQNEIISEETAGRIRSYYTAKQSATPNRLFTVFGILGALLSGLGIILIIAHNWDDLPKVIKLTFALLPLLLGQILCAYALKRKPESMAWRESASIFLILAVASSISIVSQVYHIHGNLSRFLFWWMWLTLPVIYVMRSSIAFMLFIAGITWYGCEVSYFTSGDRIPWWYWTFFVLALPHYSMLWRKEQKGNVFYFQSWMLVISLMICLATLQKSADELMLLSYMNLFGIFLCTSQLTPWKNTRILGNAPLVAGSLGTVILMLTLSFRWYWEEMADMYSYAGLELQQAYLLIGTGAGAVALLSVCIAQNGLRSTSVKSYVFIATLILLLISLSSPRFSQVAMNILILIVSVFTILNGAHQNSLKLLNYGLLILTVLIICRFFDTDLSYVLRGVLFVVVGAGFFAANYWMLKKRKAESLAR